MLRKTTVLVWLLAACLPLGASEFDEFLDHVVAGYGGPDAIAKMDSYRVVGRLTKMMGSGEGRIERDYRAPGGMRVEIQYSTHNELRILDGPQGWRGDGPAMRPAEGPMYDSMVYHLLRSDLPGALTRHRDRLIDAGEREREGATYRVLILPWSETLTMQYFIDPSAGRIIRAEGQLEAGSMKLEFATEYGDFRLVDGVLIPFLEANFASGNRVATTTVQEVTFSPPDLGPFAPASPAVTPEEI